MTQQDTQPPAETLAATYEPSEAEVLAARLDESIAFKVYSSADDHIRDAAAMLRRLSALTRRAGGDASCKAAPDHADIMETIQNAADDWQKKGYATALAEVRDMANVGRALMEALPEGYSYMDCPSEIVSDLQNERDDAVARAGGDAIPAGMKPWHGGDAAPADWDGGKVLLRDGGYLTEEKNGCPFYWTHADDLDGFKEAGDIVAYTPKPPAGGDAGELAAFGASDAACTLYPGEDQAAERAAFVAGAALALPAPVVEGDVERLADALRSVRDDLNNENGLNLHSIADVIWHGPAETTVDFIDATLAALSEGRSHG